MMSHLKMMSCSGNSIIGGLRKLCTPADEDDGQEQSLPTNILALFSTSLEEIEGMKHNCPNT